MSKLISDVAEHLQAVNDLVNKASVDENRARAIEELISTIISVLADAEQETVININTEGLADGVHDVGHGHEIVLENGTVKLQRKK